MGGPGRNDDYQDRRDDYIKNEVSVISNGVFQTAVAGKNLHLNIRSRRGNLKVCIFRDLGAQAQFLSMGFASSLLPLYIVN